MTNLNYVRMKYRHRLNLNKIPSYHDLLDPAVVKSNLHLTTCSSVIPISTPIAITPEVDVEMPTSNSTTSATTTGNNNSNSNEGRWTEQEHEKFLELLQKHGREWKLISEQIPTRTIVQIRTHAQKFFKKLAKTTGTPVLSTSKKRIQLHNQPNYKALMSNLDSTNLTTITQGRVSKDSTATKRPMQDVVSVSNSENAHDAKRRRIESNVQEVEGVTSGYPKSSLSKHQHSDTVSRKSANVVRFSVSSSKSHSSETATSRLPVPVSSTSSSNGPETETAFSGNISPLLLGAAATMLNLNVTALPTAAKKSVSFSDSQMQPAVTPRAWAAATILAAQAQAQQQQKQQNLSWAVATLSNLKNNNTVPQRFHPALYSSYI